MEYILGKAYYHKGRHYLDLSIKYLKRSLDHGYEAEDSYKYLGLAYSELGMYKEGVVYFLKSLDKKPDDMLYLALGQTYYKMEDDQTSEKYLLLALKTLMIFLLNRSVDFFWVKSFSIGMIMPKLRNNIIIYSKKIGILRMHTII